MYTIDTDCFNDLDKLKNYFKRFSGKYKDLNGDRRPWDNDILIETYDLNK
jgi:hypothetical protein